MPRACISALRRAVAGAAILVSFSLVTADIAAAVEGDPVPVPVDAVPVDTSPVEVRHQVRKGESLSLIARRNGVTVSALAAANGITNLNRIFVGQLLVIPASGAPPAAMIAAVTPGAPVANEVSYVLRRGDSLIGVARRFNVTVGVIAAANRITNPNRVLAGTRLIIPTAPGAAPVDTSVVTTPTTPAPLPVAVPPVPEATAGGLTAAAMAPWLSADQLARLPQGLHTYPERLAVLPSFDRWAAEYGVAPDLLKAVAWMESGWQQSVISSSGAIGIGQLLPATAAWVAGFLIRAPLDPYVADDNIRMSARFLAHLLTLTNGDVNLAVAGYYQGLTSIRRDGMKATTAAYVTVVLALRARF
jgi:N-acetylmuramoyl-L-alanine amidase